jgi:hypothetical protein
MTEANPQLACLRDQRLAAHALSPAPVWLWSTDAEHILRANPAGAAIFDAASPGLRGFGAALSGMLVCSCSRLTLANNTNAIPIVSTERAARDLSLPDRAHRLLADLNTPAAIFAADGELIDALPSAQTLLGDRRDLITLDAERLAREASHNGAAEGEISAGQISMLKLGAGSTFTLSCRFRDSCGSVGGRFRGDYHGAEYVGLHIVGNTPAPVALALCMADRCRGQIQPCNQGISRTPRAEDVCRA